MSFSERSVTADSLRSAITAAYRMDETTCIENLLQQLSFSSDALARIQTTAHNLVVETRAQRSKQSGLDGLLHQYDLTSNEGLALMCLAEALLRIPDARTRDLLINDKIGSINWLEKSDQKKSLFKNATSWSLMLTSKIFSSSAKKEKSLLSSITRPFILQGMKLIGNYFVTGQTIEEALKNAREPEEKGYCFSYDMLGEAARTANDAKRYFESYQHAIIAIGENSEMNDPIRSSGISIKLSALHPRYEYTKHDQVMKELLPPLTELIKLAKKYNIGVTIDAEEADRLDLSLDIFAAVFSLPELAPWEGLGIVVQAYQKRAPFVIDWLARLAQQHNRRIMVRLVKGAYWDAEIKQSQVLGLEGYPVFTRKNSTDVSYLVCAKKLLALPACFYPQFGTHNAHSVAAILEMAKLLPVNPGAGRTPLFEFQCLHGMGRSLYDQIVASTPYNIPCRIYAPVGRHMDLVGYLVRRLLENGSNSSFINRIADERTPIASIITDPIARIAGLPIKLHPHIPLPQGIYPDRSNSQGIDLSNSNSFAALNAAIQLAMRQSWTATPVINGKFIKHGALHPVIAPMDTTEIVGHAYKAAENEVADALRIAEEAKNLWENTPVHERALSLERAADLFQQALPSLAALLIREGGKTIADAISEIRETIDYCRYYAMRARLDFAPENLQGPTGEANQFSLHPRGLIVCISPWNFPLAIFSGQIVAALVSGNVVIAKPAEQTPLIAAEAVRILHEAGIPGNVLQLLLGRGSVLGPQLIADLRVSGVMFTGSTETAQMINQTLAARPGPIVPFIAETGGQNVMIVDSSALPEQTVADVILSAFNSAGQRCSALRVLFIQEDIAAPFLEMLKGAMAELTIGSPNLLSTDIGPVIDQGALQMLQQHADKMSNEAKLIYQAPLQAGNPGHYFAPCAFELQDLKQLEGEVFGPILHVLRYAASDLDAVLESVRQTGYGLTLGIHSRIESTVKYIIERMPVGNIYVNRNMIGAVVGVQPFGGERLSGTGPKAGGPHYLPRLCVERSISTNTTAVGGNTTLVTLNEDD